MSVKSDPRFRQAQLALANITMPRVKSVLNDKVKLQQMIERLYSRSLERV